MCRHSWWIFQLGTDKQNEWKFDLSSGQTLMDPVWPDDGIKSCLISPKNCSKRATLFLLKSDIICNSPKSNQNIWATIVRQFAAKNL